MNEPFLYNFIIHCFFQEYVLNHNGKLLTSYFAESIMPLILFDFFLSSFQLISTFMVCSGILY